MAYKGIIYATRSSSCSQVLQFDPTNLKHELVFNLTENLIRSIIFEWNSDLCILFGDTRSESETTMAKFDGKEW